MAPRPIHQNTLFYGDNLDVLRDYVPSESIDLIYLDPPFNSNRSYNVLFKDESGGESEAQITAFDDTWHWGEAAEETYFELVSDYPPHIAKMVDAMRDFIGTNQVMAYLVMMTIRLVELHRILKNTGSLYLHCDPTASHYLKVILDAIFGTGNFQNEIIWKRTSAHSSANKYGPVHDVILFYSKSSEFVWNQQYSDYDDEYINTFFDTVDEDGKRYKRSDLTGAGIRRGESGKPWHGIDVTSKGRHWMHTPAQLDELDTLGKIHWPKKEGGMPRLKQYPEDLPGTALQDVWADIRPMHNLSAERLGYPTQKSLDLLERIVQASSNPGDWVLDPFCGCGTAIAAAQKLGRHWIGIDITHLAIALQKYRLKDMFDLVEGQDYEVIGEPVSINSARQLALQDRFQFQWWALSLIKAKPLGGDEESKKGRKGKDKGIDGIINFIDGPNGRLNSILVQVKSGHVSSKDIRDLRGTVEREKAAIGVFITLEPPTSDMVKEAISAGFYVSKIWGQNYPKIQIITIEDLLDSGRVQMPPSYSTFKQAGKVKKEEGVQGKLDL